MILTTDRYDISDGSNCLPIGNNISNIKLEVANIYHYNGSVTSLK